LWVSSISIDLFFMRAKATVKSLFALNTNNLQIYITTLHTHKSLSKKKLEDFLVSPKLWNILWEIVVFSTFLFFFKRIILHCDADVLFCAERTREYQHNSDDLKHEAFLFLICDEFFRVCHLPLCD
jgi:hypothetical protein